MNVGLNVRRPLSPVTVGTDGESRGVGRTVIGESVEAVVDGGRRFEAAMLALPVEVVGSAENAGISSALRRVATGESSDPHDRRMREVVARYLALREELAAGMAGITVG